MKKLITHLILLILFFSLADIAVAEEHQIPLSQISLPGRLEGTGTHFELKNSKYLNVTLDTSEPIKIILESVPEMVSLHIESVSGATSAQITLSGFLPSTTYYKYEDNYHNLVTFTTDSSGRHTYTQDLSKPHFIFIQPRASTVFLTDTGLSDPSVGVWDPVTRIATLTKDLNQSIQIDTDNVILNGNGHTITGDNTGYGVYLSNRTAITIKNLKIQRFAYGTHLLFSNNNTFVNNSFTNSFAGVWFNRSNNNKFTNNTFNSNGSYGVFLGSSSNNNLSGNTVSNNTYGILLYYIQFSSIFSNNNIISDNTISLNGSGIHLSNSNNNSLSNNTLSNNRDAGINLSYGCSNNNVIDNDISFNDIGIILYSANNNELTGNTISSSSADGIYLKGYKNMLSGNIVSKNSRGIYFDGFLEEGDFNTLSGNTISNNLREGIYLYSADNNILFGNTIDLNRTYGIYLRQSSENKIYNNDFLNNSMQAYVSGGSDNVFSLNKPVGGNHWSEWTSPDSDADGFVDNPYVFSGGQDNLPWARQSSWLVGVPTTLSEKTSNQSTLTETLLNQKANLTDVVVSGDFDSTLDFTNFEMVTITTGPFAGKGFSKGEFETTLEGISYRGNWQGVLYLKPQERKIYLKGCVSGDISGVVEGYLTESILDSGVYDQYQATWKLGWLGSTITSATIELKGTLNYQGSSKYPLTNLYLLQTNIEGDISGRYAGPLNTVLTHLRVVSENSPYFREGFSIISYASEQGSGEGWTYDKEITPGKVELRGMFTSPLLGILSATLDETKSPRTLSLKIEGIDLGLPPQPDLKVRVWGPKRVSPGQTIDYIIEYRNDGLKGAGETLLFVALDYSLKYISASEGVFYNDILHTVDWNLGSLPAKSSGYLSVKTEVVWGLPQGTTLETDAIINELLPHSDKKGIFVNGIGLYKGDKRDEDYARTCGNFASSRDLEWLEAYNTGSGIDDVGEVINAENGIATKHNGLKDSRLINKEYKSAWGYSGGTRTIVTAIFMYGLKVKELVLISPVRIVPAQLEALHNSFGVEKIIIYQSEKDKLFWGGLSQLKIPKDDPLRNQPWLEVRDRDYKHPLWLQKLLNEDNKNKENLSSTTPHAVTTARDPNEKIVYPKGNIKPGDRLTYTINYENEGEGIAFCVYITDTLDENLDEETLTVNDTGSYDPHTRTITWFIGKVDSRQKGAVSFSVSAKTDLAEGTEIINFATVHFPSVPEVTETNGTVNRVSMDNIAPVTTSIISPSPNPAGWNNTDVIITLTATDNEGGSGVKEVHYKLTGAISEERIVLADTTQISLTAEGITKLTYYAIDNAGNIETQRSLEIKIDKTPPLVSLNLEPYEIKLPFKHEDFHFLLPFFYRLVYSATDNLSGIKAPKAGLVIPDIDSFKTQLIKAEYINIILDEQRKHLAITAPNPIEILNQLKANLLLIDNNQALYLNQRPKARIWTITKLDRFLIIKAPSIIFKAEAEDYADNSSTKELQYVKKRIPLPEYLRPLIKNKKLTQEEIEEIIKDTQIDKETLKIILKNYRLK